MGAEEEESVGAQMEVVMKDKEWMLMQVLQLSRDCLPCQERDEDEAEKSKCPEEAETSLEVVKGGLRPAGDITFPMSTVHLLLWGRGLRARRCLFGE